LQKGFQGFPRAKTQIGQQFSVPQEEAPQELGNREHEVPVGDGLEHVTAKPLAELHHTFLMAGGAEVAALTGEGQQKIAAATLADKTGEPCVQVATGQVPKHDLFAAAQKAREEAIARARQMAKSF
jgi:hypothetical protein